MLVSHTGASAGWTSRDTVIDGLAAAATLKCAYSDDGAADATVLQDPVPEVRAVLALQERAIPILIRHLDDQRPTAATFSTGSFHRTTTRVPVGYVCLDILTNIVATKNGIIRTDCADDGLGACVAAGYYFRPDATLAGAKANMRAVKARWQRAYDRRWLSFRYPSWLHHGAQLAVAPEPAQLRQSSSAGAVARAR
jgi:hypothetical protein